MRAEGRAWVLLLVHGTVLTLRGLYWLARGGSMDRELYEAIVGPSWHTVLALAPAVEELVSALSRFTGALGIASGILVIAIATTSFRRGDRWAWYAAWALPLQAACDLAILFGYGAVTPRTASWDAVLLVLSVSALIAASGRASEGAPDHAAT